MFSAIASAVRVLHTPPVRLIHSIWPIAFSGGQEIAGKNTFVQICISYWCCTVRGMEAGEPAPWRHHVAAYSASAVQAGISVTVHCKVVTWGGGLAMRGAAVSRVGDAVSL